MPCWGQQGIPEVRGQAAIHILVPQVLRLDHLDSSGPQMKAFGHPCVIKSVSPTQECLLSLPDKRCDCATLGQPSVTLFRGSLVYSLNRPSYRRAQARVLRAWTRDRSVRPLKTLRQEPGSASESNHTNRQRSNSMKGLKWSLVSDRPKPWTSPGRAAGRQVTTKN